MDLLNTAAWQRFAPDYTLMTEDWDALTNRRAHLLAPLLHDDPRPPLHVLDLACGPGGDLIGLRKRGHIVTGVDRSAAMVAAARANVRRHDVRARLLVGDALRPPFRRSPAFHAILFGGNSVGIFSDPRELQRIFNSIRPMLRPHGRFVVGLRDHSAIEATPGCRTVDGPFECRDRHGARTVSQTWDWISPEIYDCAVRIRFFDARQPIDLRFERCRAWRWEEIASLLATAGFRVREVVQAPAGPSVYAAGLDQIVIVAEIADAGAH